MLSTEVTSVDANKAIQRSLTKACARHGLGLYIYEGEDVPQSIGVETEEQYDAAADQQADNQQQAPAPDARKVVGNRANTNRYRKIADALNAVEDKNAFWQIYWDHKAEILGNPEIKYIFNKRKAELGLV